tara:strand:+ start:757 stop:1974 length:1218 start_codon:yes stop_codon:yes gene_type:complete
MKNKAILVSFIALFAIVFALNTVMADFVSITEVEVDGRDSTPFAIEVGETIPIEVEFMANDDVDDVKVKVYIEGYKSEISETTGRFHVLTGRNYVERLSLDVPSDLDLDDLYEDLELFVRFSAKGETSVEETYEITLQRPQENINILSVEAPQGITAGSTIPFDVVIENSGHNRLDNIYVKISVPDLGVERKVYFGDIVPTEELSYDDIVDTMNKRIYLTIPRNAIPGIYSVEVEAYNYDVSVMAEKKVIVSSATTGIIPSVTSRAVGIGEETTFDVVLVNPNDRIVVYSLTPEESTGLIIDVEEPIVAVQAGSSETVKVRVKATNSAEEGTHLVTINVNSESGLVKQVNFSLNVEEGTSLSRPNSVLVLTVILAIIFVVLLIVLIVLLTKKPVEAEEFGETSYY